MNWGRLFYDVDLLTGVSRRAKSFRRRKNWPGPAYFFRALWRRDLIQLTSHLSAIVRCNAPISSGLERALTDAPSLKLSQAMIAMRDDLASGLRIGESLAKYPRFYPAWYVNLIATGESTGSLTSAFDSAGQHLAQIRGAKRNITLRILYVLFLFVIQLSIATFLLVFIVPEFQQVLDDFDVEPPATFAILTDIATWFRFMNFPELLGIAILTWIVATIAETYLRHRVLRGRRVLRDLLSALPFARGLITKSDLADVCSVLKRLTTARVPLNEALRDCASLDITSRSRRALAHARRSVEQGASLGDALRDQPAFPDSFRALLALGESAGNLPLACDQLEQMYRQQINTRGRIVSEVIGATGVMVLGAISFVIYVGMFSAMLAVPEALINNW